MKLPWRLIQYTPQLGIIIIVIILGLCYHLSPLWRNPSLDSFHWCLSWANLVQVVPRCRLRSSLHLVFGLPRGLNHLRGTQDVALMIHLLSWSLATWPAHRCFDNITTAVLQDGGEPIIKALTQLFNRCLSNGRVPSSWKNASVVLIYKKGDTADIKNYRPISLLPVIYKVFSHILLQRMLQALEQHQPQEQLGIL